MFHKLVMSQPYEEKQAGFSDLPQEVICEILGYLDIEDLARSNTLSKDLNKWCTLVPRLHINRPNMNGEENTNKRDNFFEFLRGYSQKVFEQKRLRYIKLCWDFSLCIDEEEDHVEAWLSRAARDTNVKEIDIDISCTSAYRPFVVPPCVFQRCPSLERLTLKVYRGIVNTGHAFAFDALRFLRLGEVEIPSDNFFDKLLSESCKNLEELVLENIFGGKNLSIICHSLQTLHIIKDFGVFDSIDVQARSLKNLIIEQGFSPDMNSIRIFAPNLVYLVMEGSVAKNYYLDNFKFLHFAEVHSKTHPHYTSNCIGRNTHKLLQCVSEAKTLHVGEKFLEVCIT